MRDLKVREKWVLNLARDICEAGKYKANDGMNLAYDNSRRCSAAGHALVAPVLAGLQA
jgi:hypothetical protein